MRFFHFFLPSLLIFFSIPSWGMDENMEVRQQGSIFSQKGPNKRSFNPGGENNSNRIVLGNITNTSHLQNNKKNITRCSSPLISTNKTVWQKQDASLPPPPKKPRGNAPTCDVLPLPDSIIPEQHGIWCRTLDYKYKGKAFSTDNWHYEAASKVRQAHNEYKSKNPKKINFGMARIEAIFHEESEGQIKLERRDYKFPEVFSSSNIDSKYICYSQLPGDANQKIKFLEKLLDRRITEKNFEQEYYHTENAILRYVLKNSSEWIGKIKPKKRLDKKYTLAHFVLTICSYYDSCPNCSQTMYRAALDKQFYLKKLNKKFRAYGLNKEDNEDNIGIFINVSSLSEYKGSRRYMNSSNVSDDFKVPEFSPFFAQMALDLQSLNPQVPSFYIGIPKIIQPSPTFEKEKEYLQQKLEDQKAPTRPNLFLQSFSISQDTEAILGEKDQGLIEFVKVPKICTPPLIFEKEEEDSEQIAETQDALARETLFLQLFGTPLDAEENLGEKDQGLIESTKTPKASLPPSIFENEEENLEQITEAQDALAREDLYLKLFGNASLVPQENAEEKVQTRVQLAKASLKEDIAAEEKKTLDDPSEILHYLVDLLASHELSDNKHMTIKPLFEEAFLRKTANKAARDPLLNRYLNPINYIASGDKMPPNARNTAFLLKIFGWLYLNDRINNKKQLLLHLNKIERDNQENNLGIIAYFFLDEIKSRNLK